MSTLRHYAWLTRVKNYYQAKNLLIKRGFQLVSHPSSWRDNERVDIIFQGCNETVILTTRVLLNPLTKKWSCGKILNVRNYTED